MHCHSIHLKSTQTNGHLVCIISHSSTEDHIKYHAMFSNAFEELGDEIKRCKIYRTSALS